MTRTLVKAAGFPILFLALSLGALASSPTLRVADLAGASHAIPTAGAKATVLFFIAHDCPISLSYAPLMNQVCRDYSPKGVSFYIVYAEPDLSLAAARKHANAYRYACPAILDTRLSLARRAGATITPEAVILSPQGQVLYRGRIDNLYAGYGVRRAHATSNDLENALNCILAGKPAPKPWASAFGCFIPNMAAG